jgi:hypothetical protein
MPRIIITIETDNEAFEDSPTGEVSRILKEIGKDLRENGPRDYPVRDKNGNKVGRVEWED